LKAETHVLCTVFVPASEASSQSATSRMWHPLLLLQWTPLIYLPLTVSCVWTVPRGGVIIGLVVQL
jgi:hypothetical protein